jgi:hypothetical protein
VQEVEDEEDDYEFEDENGRFFGEDRREAMQRHLREEVKYIEVELLRLEDLQRRIPNITSDIVSCCVVDLNVLPLKDKLCEIGITLRKLPLEGIVKQVNKNVEAALQRFQPLTVLAGNNPTNVINRLHFSHFSPVALTELFGYIHPLYLA